MIPDHERKADMKALQEHRVHRIDWRWVVYALLTYFVLAAAFVVVCYPAIIGCKP